MRGGARSQAATVLVVVVVVVGGGGGGERPVRSVSLDTAACYLFITPTIVGPCASRDTAALDGEGDAGLATHCTRDAAHERCAWVREKGEG